MAKAKVAPTEEFDPMGPVEDSVEISTKTGKPKRKMTPRAPRVEVDEYALGNTLVSEVGRRGAGAGPRTSYLTVVLQNLVDKTNEGAVPRDPATNELQFKLIAEYNSPAGASGQAKSVEDKNPGVFEFRWPTHVLEKGGRGSKLYARVMETK